MGGRGDTSKSFNENKVVSNIDAPRNKPFRDKRAKALADEANRATKLKPVTKPASSDFEPHTVYLDSSTHRSVRQDLGDKSIKLTGERKGDFLVHETNTLHSVTHLPSGGRMGSFDRIEQARSFVNKLQPLSKSVEALSLNTHGNGMQRGRMRPRDRRAAEAAVANAKRSAIDDN